MALSLRLNCFFQGCSDHFHIRTQKLSSINSLAVATEQLHWSGWGYGPCSRALSGSDEGGARGAIHFPTQINPAGPGI